MAWCLQKLEEQQGTWGGSRLISNRVLMLGALDLGPFWSEVLPPSPRRPT